MLVSNVLRHKTRKPALEHRCPDMVQAFFEMARQLLGSLACHQRGGDGQHQGPNT